MSTYLDRIQGFFNETNSELTSSITAYFNDWQSLSSDPTNTGMKQTLVSQGQALAQSIGTIYTGVKGIQGQADHADSVGRPIGKRHALFHRVAQ